MFLWTASMESLGCGLWVSTSQEHWVATLKFEFTTNGLVYKKNCICAYLLNSITHIWTLLNRFICSTAHTVEERVTATFHSMNNQVYYYLLWHFHIDRVYKHPPTLIFSWSPQLKTLNGKATNFPGITKPPFGANIAFIVLSLICACSVLAWLWLPFCVGGWGSKWYHLCSSCDWTFYWPLVP